MKTWIAAAFFLSAAIAPALAMPLSASIPATNSTGIIPIAGGCGPGYHRGPFNGCLRNYADPGAHACPRGYHVGPYGGCRGNGR